MNFLLISFSLLALCICASATHKHQPIIFLGPTGVGKSTLQNHLKYGINENNFIRARTSAETAGVVPATEPISWLGDRYALWDTPGLDHWNQDVEKEKVDPRTWVLMRILEIVERTKRVPILVFVRKCDDLRMTSLVHESLKDINMILAGYQIPVIIHNNICAAGSQEMECQTCKASFARIEADFNSRFPTSLKAATYSYKNCGGHTEECIDDKRVAQQLIDALDKISISELPLELPSNWREQLMAKDLRSISAAIVENRCNMIKSHSDMYLEELESINHQENVARKTISEILAKPADLSKAACPVNDARVCQRTTKNKGSGANLSIPPIEGVGTLVQAAIGFASSIFGGGSTTEPDHQCLQLMHERHQQCIQSLPAIQEQMRVSHRNQQEADLVPLNARLAELKESRARLQALIDEWKTRADECAKLVSAI